MKAAVTVKFGAPEGIEIQNRELPTPRKDWILIKVKAFGLNRSELFTRQGHSPGVELPRIQGIECVGEVHEDPSGTYDQGQQVAAIMGGMGRFFDGGYAEFCSVPLSIVFPFTSSLPWSVLGAVPEMFQTVAGSLDTLEIRSGETLLIRGGTSSIGLLSLKLAKAEGLTVVATTRNPAKAQILRDNGADDVIIDTGAISDQVKKLCSPDGVEKVLELIGTVTLKDSLQCLRRKGICCMTGILGNAWTMPEFEPMGDIPSTRRLTCYMGGAENLSKDSFIAFLKKLEQGEVKLNIHSPTFTLDQLPETHRLMEENKASGKLVVVL